MSIALMDINQNIVEIAMEIALPKSVLDTVAQRFGPQKARECAMSTSVGGIGPLLKDRLLGQSDQGMAVIGVTFLYEYVWVQTWQEWGQLSLEKRNVGHHLRQVLTPTSIGFDVQGYNGKTYRIDVWEQKYGQASVYFLSSPDVANVVYPGLKDAPVGHANPKKWTYEERLQQSWVLGRAALTLTKKLNKKPSLILLSETPTFFGHHKLVSDEFQSDAFFSETKYIFNDHTPLEYAHPIWDQSTVEMVKLDPTIYGKSYGWNTAKKTLDVTSLLVGVCDGVFGVAKKHADVMKAMHSLARYQDKIRYVTNGVRKQEWQAPTLSDWKNMTDDALLREKQICKEKLLDWMWRHARMWPHWAREAKTKNIVVVTRRITAYKRLDILTKVISDAGMRKRFLQLNSIIFVGGRIHQEDENAQNMIYTLLEQIDKDPELRNRILFVDNFNIWDAPLLYQGASGSIMMADDTREASATGFMKAQMNGAGIIATLDGAIPEFVYFRDGSPEKDVNGFNIPYFKGEPTAAGFIDALEAFDAVMANPQKAAQLMRAALAVTDALDIQRTVNDMRALYATL